MGHRRTVGTSPVEAESSAGGALYHAGTRGIRRSRIFLADDDRLLFLAILGDVVRRFGWQCHAFCLMTNHYHLAVRTPDANIGDGMHRLNGLYAQVFNRRHGFAGHLFDARYWSRLVRNRGALPRASCGTSC